MHLQQQPNEEVIIFTRYPEPGKVKTRLIPYLGEEGAAMVHRRLTEQIIRQVLPIRQMRRVRLSLLYNGSSRRRMESWLQHAFLFEEQQEGNIGRKMAAALQSAWSRGTQRAVVIGSDCPSMNAELLARALDLLLTHDVVLGPAYDGGYYLLGLNHDLPDALFNIFFQDIAWGTAEVFHQTVQRAEKERLAIAMLEKLHDIDREEDLEYFRHYSDPQ